MSHAAIVCREYGLPAVVGTGRATSQIRTGQRIRVDGSDGTVTILRVSAAGHTRALAELRARRRRRLRRQERHARRAARGGDPGPAGFAVVDQRVPRVRRRGRARRHDRRRAGRMSLDDVDAVGAASHAISEAMRFAPDARRACATRSRDATPSWPRRRHRRAAGGGPLERARRGQPDATFAGQQETYLWVRGADAGVRRGARLLGQPLQPAGDHLPRAARRRGGAPAMGVAVQLMVDAEVSGVLFTCNPVSGDPSMVAVNASWGLGLAVVGGEVTPDDYLVSKVTREVVREHVNAKDVEYVPDAGGRGAVRVEVPTERRSAPLPGRGRARRARRRGRPRRAPLRLPPGRRVGARARRRAAGEPVVVQSRPGDGAAEAHEPAPARLGDVARDGHVRRRPDETASDGARRRRRPRDPAAHRRVRARRAADRDRGPLAPRRPRRRGADRGGAACPSATRAGAARRTPSRRRQPTACAIASPMLGTFYRAPAPGAAPFVEVGTRGRARHDRLHHRGDEDDELDRRGRRGHDRRGLRRERAARRVRRSRSSGWSPP